MSKSKLLILDANVVIYLHEVGLWPQIIGRYDVHLAETVAYDEVKYARGKSRDNLIDLSADIERNCIAVFGVDASEVAAFRGLFHDSYADDLDPGETESLAYLFSCKDTYLISSGDKIVYRILGNLGWEDRGISLQEILRRIGLSRSEIPWNATTDFQKSSPQKGNWTFYKIAAESEISKYPLLPVASERDNRVLLPSGLSVTFFISCITQRRHRKSLALTHFQSYNVGTSNSLTYD